MADMMIEETTLMSMADAIRVKNKKNEETYTPLEMVSAIKKLNTDVDQKFNATSIHAQSGIAVNQAIGIANVYSDSGDTKTLSSAKGYADEQLKAYPKMTDGKINIANIPATATVDIFEVAAPSELVGLTAQRGDLAELITDINGERTITKTWQLLGDDPTVAASWVVWGSSYSVQSGNATTANTANNTERLCGMPVQSMTLTQFEASAKDPDTLYLVDMEA